MKTTLKIDAVGTFWVVTKPTGLSTIQDIYFEADVPYMMNQCRGGLNENQIHAIYRTQAEAEHQAKYLISKRIN